MDVKSVNKLAVQPAPAAEARPATVRDNTKPREDEARKAVQAQQTKTVVNTQGQVTGRHLNVTA